MKQQHKAVASNARKLPVQPWERFYSWGPPSTPMARPMEQAMTPRRETQIYRERGFRYLEGETG